MARGLRVVMVLLVLGLALAQDSGVNLSRVVELQQLRLKGSESTFDAAFSPDGRTLATANSDNTARIWDVSSGQELKRFDGHAAALSSIAFSPDGRTLATGSFDKTVRIWDVSSGQELKRFTNYYDSIDSVVFSPDGRTLAAGSWHSEVLIFDVSSGQGRISNYGLFVNSAAFSPDGRTLVTGSSDSTVRIWDVSSGQELKRFTGHTSAVNSVSFNPDGRTFVTGSSDSTVRIWDVSSGQELKRFTGHTRPVKSVAFSPDGQILATGGFDDTVRIWDVSSGQELKRFAGDNTLGLSVVFSPDGRLIAIKSHMVKIWGTRDNAIVFSKFAVISLNAPIGATITIAGRTFVVPPSGTLEIPNLLAIPQNLGVSLDGFEPRVISVTLEPNENAIVNVPALTPLATLLVTSTTPDARVSVNGKDYGLIPTSGFRLALASSEISSATVTVSASNFVPVTQTVQLTAGSTATLSLGLTALPATLRIASPAANAKAVINGREYAIPATGLELSLPPGSYTVVLSAAGFADQTVKISLQATQRASINTTLTRGVTQPSTIAVAPQPSPAATTKPNAQVTKPISGQPRDDTAALVIGIDVYQNLGIPRLKTAVSDAKRFAAALENLRIGNISKGNIRVLTGDAAGKSNLEAEFDDALEALKANQTLIVYFAGHGAPTPDGKALLLPWDANPSAARLERSSIALSDWVSRANGKRVLFVLDSCFSGQQGSRSLTADATRPVGVQITAPQAVGAVAILGATSSNQSSQENTAGGLFTGALLEGLSGAADSNKDGTVSLEEAFNFAQRSVAGATRNAQTPSLSGTGLNTFAFAQNAELASSQRTQQQLEQLGALRRATEISAAQFDALAALIENGNAPADWLEYAQGKIDKATFLRRLKAGSIAGVPAR